MGLSSSELSILLTDDPGIRGLNRRWRNIDRPTDVLSFPLGEDGILGDIVISVERAVEQAGEFGVSVEEELSRLIVHGLLHLAGYDHVKGGRQARRMKEKERELMGVLGEEGCY